MNTSYWFHGWAIAVRTAHSIAGSRPGRWTVRQQPLGLRGPNGQSWLVSPAPEVDEQCS